MKKIFAVIAVFTLSVGAFAQSTLNNIKDKIAWQYAEVSFGKTNLDNDNGSIERDFNMTSIGYRVAFDVVPNNPNLKVETGLSYAFGSSENVQYNVLNKPLHVDYEVACVKIPVVAAYKYDVNENISIIPSAGLYAKYYTEATSNTYSDDKDVVAAYNYYGMKFGKDNHFDQNNSDYNWKHFGYGIQLGVNGVYKKHLLIGVQYSNELSKIDETFGYNFKGDISAKIGWVF